ncbi:MAG: hypothetical protein C7B45_11905 [Sulfobacillus acidophilus]|uniref:3-dehydroquinate synthase domain-containing protein n=1 Tax=Sulfobacillus acidophilus TaxID=53633 RepID=A0A2T2WG13_9FIRM|nr:MAG: hypothetical protein C7B45_11905 [Sulfobacillus acidophilus]
MTSQHWPRHPLHVYIDHDALDRLPALLMQSHVKQAYLIMSEVPIMREGYPLKPYIHQLALQAKIRIEPIYVNSFASSDQAQRVATRLRCSSAVISIGSGQITDLCKQVCHLYEQETGHALYFVAIPTANSVTSYASHLTSIWHRDVKVSMPARSPDVILADLRTLHSAPPDLSRSGLGDLAAKFVALADWYLAASLGLGDPFEPRALDWLKPIDQLYDEWPPQGGPLDSFYQTHVLCEALLVAGLTMSVLHQSTPLSGFEHVATHALDIWRRQRKGESGSHGIHVAAFSAMASHMWEALFAGPTPNLAAPTRSALQEIVISQFTALDPTNRLGHQFWQVYSEKLQNWEQMSTHIAQRTATWDESLKPHLATLLKPSRWIESSLQRAGLPLRFTAINPPISPAEYLWAMGSAPFIRKRFTLGDLQISNPWMKASS